MATSRDVTLLSSSFADAVLKLDTLIDEQSTELNIRKGSPRRNITVHALEAPEGIGNRINLTGSGHGNDA